MPVRDRPDVIVIGAGIIGCAVACELGRRGAAVRVLESRVVGGGATQASAGILAPFIEADRPGSLRTLGAESLELWDDFVARVVVDSGGDVLYERTGTLEVATDEPSMRRLERTRSALLAAGVEGHLLTAREACAAEPSLSRTVGGGLLIPSHGFVGAAAVTSALRQAGAARHGVSFLTGQPARRVRVRPAGGMAVETAAGTLTGDAVVLAAGSWSGGVAVEGEAALPVRPVRGQLLRLAWTGDPLARVVWSPGCYVVPWPDGSMLVGATIEDVGFDERATVSGVAALIEAVGGVLPKARNAGFEAVRVGLRPGTPDDLPVVGSSPAAPRLVYATGHYRNGVLLAPLTARLVADLMLDGREDPLLAAVAPGRFDAA